ncbi:MAG: tRNA guanosine(34) transglycosylase Tgt [Patescibacteria group bacterium]
MIEFRVEKQSTQSRARLGVLKTPHGEVQTPCLTPVATQASVKTLTSEEAAQADCQILIANTFHLHLKPGEDISQRAGSLHEFMHWGKPLMTDSGGFQVFSLGFGRDHGVGKILKEKSDESVREGEQPQNLKITDDGVTFRSPLDGSPVFLGPKESMDIQQKLGADVIFAFDEATSPVADAAYTQKSLERTHRWAELCLEHKTSDQALYGIVQGGKFPSLRKESAQYIASLPFAGFGIGGEYGDDKQKMTELLEAVISGLPESKPRHLLGIGHPEDIPEIIKAGIDTFDCIVPTHYARHGVAFISPAGTRLDLMKSQFLADQEPLDTVCQCFVCQQYKRSYISHLIRSKEITGLKLLTFHNLFWFNTYVASLREQIKNSQL